MKLFSVLSLSAVLAVPCFTSTVVSASPAMPYPRAGKAAMNSPAMPYPRAGSKTAMGSPAMPYPRAVGKTAMSSPAMPYPRAGK
jgi:hypothetical protein